MTTATISDPYDTAMNPSQPTQERTYFGLVTIVDPWFCVLQKGVSKRPFDATVDDMTQRSTAIKLSVEVEKRDGDTYTLDQDTLDWSKEWRDFTLPSLRQLTIDLRTLKGRYVQVKRQSTGETYTNKTTGELKAKSALVFMAVYDDLAAMKAAAEVFYTPRGSSSDAAPAAQPVPSRPVASPAPAASENSAERQFAEQSLTMLWKALGNDVDKFYAAIETNPMIARHFNRESAEVRDLTLPF